MDTSQTKRADEGLGSSDSPPLRLAGRLNDAVREAADPAAIEALLGEARALLGTLKVDRSRVEARLAELGRDDPIAKVKGRSALDQGIASCQRIIAELDRSMLGSPSRSPE